MLEQTVGFLGAGKMGEALARGLLAGRLATPDRILMSDVDDGRLEQLARQLQVGVAEDNAELVQASDVVV